MILNYFFLNIPNLLDYHVPTYLNNYFHLFTNSQKRGKEVQVYRTHVSLAYYS